MEEFEVGDFIVSQKNKEVYKIIKIQKVGLIKIYDLDVMYPPPTKWEVYCKKTDTWTTEEIKATVDSVPRNFLRHLGSLIKEKDAKTLKILFSKD